jgi:hypothetical protein
MIDHRVGDLTMLKLLFYFLSLLFFLLGTEAFSKGLHAASVTSACSSFFFYFSSLLFFFCVGDLGMLVALLPPPFVFGVCGSLVCVRVRYYMCGCV